MQADRVEDQVDGLAERGLPVEPVQQLAELPRAILAADEVAGPEQFRLDELIRMVLRARGIRLEVVADPQARYFGALLGERTLVPWGDDAMLSETRVEDWLKEPVL